MAKETLTIFTHIFPRPFSHPCLELTLKLNEWMSQICLFGSEKSFVFGAAAADTAECCLERWEIYIFTCVIIWSIWDLSQQRLVHCTRNIHISSANIVRIYRINYNVLWPEFAFSFAFLWEDCSEGCQMYAVEEGGTLGAKENLARI